MKFLYTDILPIGVPEGGESFSSAVATEISTAERVEDSPEMTADMLLQFKRMNQEERNKQTVSLRLSPKTMKIAKSYGKGYTSFLSRLLDEAIQDESLVRKCI